MFLSGRTQVLSYPIIHCLEVICRLGFDGVELCLESEDVAPRLLNKDQARKIREKLQELDLLPNSISYHKNYIFDDERFEETKKAIRLTPEFGTEVFVFAGCSKTNRPDEWKLMVERTRELVAIAEDHGVTLAQEFEPGFIVGSTSDLHRLFNEIPSPNLTANLDLGHVFLCDPEPLAAIASLRGKVSHCHVENMATGIHKHLPPDEGDMDLPQYFSALKDIGFDGPLALDLYNCDYETVAARTIPYLRHLIGIM